MSTADTQNMMPTSFGRQTEQRQHLQLAKGGVEEVGKIGGGRDKTIECQVAYALFATVMRLPCNAH